MAKHLKLLFILLVVASLLLEHGDAWLFRRRRRRRCSVPTRNRYRFDQPLATTLMKHSSLAYLRNGRLLREWSCKNCRKDKDVENFQIYGVQFHSGHFVRAHTGYDPVRKAIIVAFRGTENYNGRLRNWIVNLRFRLVRPGRISAGRGRVHSGFYNAYLSLRNGIRRDVSRLRSKHGHHRKVYFTGHSLGGALAVLAAMDFSTSAGIPKHQLAMINFGAPRVGDACFVNHYNRYVPNSIRVAHRLDFVVHLPFKIIGYRHVPRTVRDPEARYWERSHSTYLGVRISKFIA